MLQVEDLQKNLVEEQKIVAEKKEKTGALIEAIGKEKIQARSACTAQWSLVQPRAHVILGCPSCASALDWTSMAIAVPVSRT